MGRPRKESVNRCEARTRTGGHCKAEAVPGKKLCMSHIRRGNLLEKQGRVFKAGPIKDMLYPEEVASYEEIHAQLVKEFKPRTVADSLGVERMAMAAIQARRADAALRAGDKSAARVVYFANLTMMNWMKTLAADRRFRVRRADETGKYDRLFKKFPWLKGGGEPRPIDLNRGNNGQAASDVSGADRERPGGVLPGGSQGEPAPEAGTSAEESGAVPDGRVGTEGREEQEERS